MIKFFINIYKKIKKWKYFPYAILIPIFLFDLSFLFAPFWYDESWRVMRVVGKEYLINNQLNYIAFPIGIELITKLLSSLFGNREIIFRIPILLISLSISIFFINQWKGKIKILILWFLLIIFNFNYTFFSNTIEYKQLATDGVFFLICFYLITKISPQNILKLSLLIVFMNLFSMNVVFLIPTICLYVLFENKINIPTKIKTLTLFLTSIIITFLTYVDHSQTGKQILDVYWENSFISINKFSDLYKIIKLNLRVLDNLFLPQLVFLKKLYIFNILKAILEILSLLLVIIGIKKYKSKLASFSIIATLLIINILSYFKMWPLGFNRVNLFLYPLFFFLIINTGLFFKKTLFYPMFFILIFMTLNILNTFVVYYKFPLKPLFRTYTKYTDPLQIDRISDGMKCAVNEILKTNKKNDTIVLYHALTEPIFGYYYWFHTWSKNYQTKINSYNIFTNENYLENANIYPDKSEVFFKDRFQKGSVYIIMIVGVNQKFAETQIERASKFGNLEKQIPCQGYINLWIFNPKKINNSTI